MPAERTKGSRRSTESGEGHQLVWTMPMEHTSASDFAFTGNTVMSPSESFLDGPPPLVDVPPPGEFILFPPPDECSSPSRRVPHSKKKPENHIPRPPNAFILFRSSFIKSQHVSTEVETNHSTLSKIIGLTWQNLPEEERKVWHNKAKDALEEHKRKFPKYAFRPSQTRGKGGGTPDKRRVREVEPKDLKRCAKIAELLVEGKKGQELDVAIQEFDKHHVPEVITRFETPITARAYRRSSSAPIPDTDNSRESQTFLVSPTSTSHGRKKVRASSTRPTRCLSPDQLSRVEEVYGAQSIHDTQLTHTPSPSLKREPSFDFSTFSFDNVTESPLQQFECDPLLGMPTDPFDPLDRVQQNSFDQEAFDHVQQQTPYDHAQEGNLYSPASLSIDTSFMSSWTSAHQCASPVSPMTPEFLSSPSPSPSYANSSFEDILSFTAPLTSVKSDFDNLSGPQYAVYEQRYPHDMGMGSDAYLAQGAEGAFSTFIHQQPEMPLAPIDFQFATFMNSIPQYGM